MGVRVPNHSVFTPLFSSELLTKGCLAWEEAKPRCGRTSLMFFTLSGESSHPMEDFVVSEFKRVDCHELGLFAIFNDLVHDVAKYLQTNLFGNIIKEIGKGGTTAVTGIIIDGQKLVVALMLETHGEWCLNGVAHQLSVDHGLSK
ncbi:unnamed protein product [Eruca vesicaria subsp. sativa]|uniref:Uncharacterized protein n=1 Tax=Eruca vesicaria subsp. sativa TaxID=29727 RepID=A0ABC8JXM1_ERUVS|nr:unnamed protein product [Eruca vesicaria subsp. sativa]